MCCHFSVSSRKRQRRYPGSLRMPALFAIPDTAPAPFRDDAVDGSLPRRRCAKRVSGETRTREPPMSEISIIGLDLMVSLSNHGEAGFLGSRSRCGGALPLAQAAQAARGSAVFRWACALHRGDGGLRFGPLLGARDRKAWPRGEAAASGLRQALCEARQGRSARRRAGRRCALFR